MTNFDPEAPLNRIANESAKAHAALVDYWTMGPGRSLVSLGKLYSQRAESGGLAKKPPTLKINTLTKWSYNHHWQARIGRQKELDDAIALAAFRERHMSPGEVLARLSDQARADMAKFANVLTPADLAGMENSPLVKKVTAHYKQGKDGKVAGRVIIELHDAQKALELLGKHHGLFTDNLNVQGSMDVKGYTTVNPDDWDDDTDNS